MNKRGKNIPVYDICSLADTVQLQQDIIAEDFAHYLARHPGLHFPHRHSFYHLVYFTGGGGTHTIDFETFPVRVGQIYFMIPGQVHSWYFKGAVTGFIVNFSGHFLHPYLNNGDGLSQFPFFSGSAADGVVQLQNEKAKAEALLQTIVSESAADKPYSMELVKIGLLSLFIHVARDMEPIAAKPHLRQNHLILQNFRKLVEQHFSHMRLPKDYAAMLYITPNHLNALCTDLLGKPAGEFIRDRVLLEAKRLLVSATATVAEIAYQLDFPDNSYFTKFFKKYTGITPEEFRHDNTANNKK